MCVRGGKGCVCEGGGRGVCVRGGGGGEGVCVRGGGGGGKVCVCCV